MHFETPVLFIIFNRPDTTVKVFERIKEIKPKRLFVAADGPRDGREGEKEKCELVRKIVLDGIDWECDLQLKFSETNLGCGRATSSAMLWFFENAGEGIVLEDDTIPDPTFFNFCKELLAWYRNDDDIKMIGGNNLQNGHIRSDGSYYFSNITHSWGYASWWRVWKDYDFYLENINDDIFEQLIQERFHTKAEKEYWRDIYKNLRAGKYEAWDYQFLFTMWLKNGMCIIPNKNLVTNIGFGEDATHTKSTDDPAANRPLASIHKIVHPSEKKISYKADRFLFNNYFKGENNWRRRLRKALHILKNN